MSSTLEVVLWIVVITLAVVLAAYLILRWVAFRVAHTIALAAERRLASTLAPGARRAQARFAAPAAGLDDAQVRRSLAELDRLAWLMDRVIPLPIIGGVGLDALLGLVPVAGDLLSLGISSIVIVRAAQLGAPPELLSKLVAIQCIDLVLGVVPVVGDLVDAGYQANQRSVQLLRDWLHQRPGR